MLCNYTQMKMTHLYQPQPNMSSIGEGCDSLGKTFLTSLVSNLWATGGFRMNSYSGEVSFPVLLLEGNAILPMTPRADCGGGILLLWKDFFLRILALFFIKIPHTGDKESLDRCG